MKRTKKVSRLDENSTKRARRALVFTNNDESMDIDTVQNAVNWLEGISGELWIIALEKAGAGRLDFDWIQKFSLINKDTYRYTFSKELWRYLYESMLVAPAARPTHLLDDISNVSTPSYRSLREESQIHYTFFLPYVFHYGIKGDSEGNIYNSEADLPEWKVWKRMVEVLRRRRMMILNKLPFEAPDGNNVPDPSSFMGYSDTTDKVKLDDSTGDSNQTLGTEYSIYHTTKRLGPSVFVERFDDDVNFTNVLFETEDNNKPRDVAEMQNVHISAVSTREVGDIVSRSLPACPWPIVYGVDAEKGAWIGLALPHKVIYAGLLEVGRHATDRFHRMDQLFSLVAQPNGLLNVFCLGTSSDLDEPSVDNRPNPPEELVVWMHTVRLDLLIRNALEHIKNLDYIRKYSHVEWHNIEDFVVGMAPRVFFSLSPTSNRFPRFPSSQWILDKRFNYMPLALSASRRYLAFTFHHGCQLFEWSYADTNVIPYDFFNWELLSNNKYLPPVSTTEYDDGAITEVYTNRNSILPHLKLIMHAPDMTNHRAAVETQPFNPDILFNAPGTNRMSAPYPENRVTRHVDLAEIRCDPLGSNRLIIAIGISNAEYATYNNTTTRSSYYSIIYATFGMVMHPKLSDTRFNYIGFHETLDTPAFDAIPNRLLRDSLDGVALMIPTPEVVTDMEDRTFVVSIIEKVEVSVVGWIDVSDRRQTLPRLTTFTQKITNAFLTRMVAWDYLPGGLLVTPYQRIATRSRPNEELGMEAGFKFVMPVRGGWRVRDEEHKPQAASRKFVHRYQAYGQYPITQPKNIVLFAGGNTFMAYNVMLFYRTPPAPMEYSLHELTLNLSRYELGPNRLADKFVVYVPKGSPLPNPLAPKRPASPVTEGTLSSNESLDELVDEDVINDETLVPRPGVNNYLSANKLKRSYVQ